MNGTLTRWTRTVSCAVVTVLVGAWWMSPGRLPLGLTGVVVLLACALLPPGSALGVTSYSTGLVTVTGVFGPLPAAAVIAEPLAVNAVGLAVSLINRGGTAARPSPLGGVVRSVRPGRRELVILDGQHQAAARRYRPAVVQFVHHADWVRVLVAAPAGTGGRRHTARSLRLLGRLFVPPATALGDLDELMDVLEIGLTTHQAQDDVALTVIHLDRRGTMELVTRGPARPLRASGGRMEALEPALQHHQDHPRPVMSALAPGESLVLTVPGAGTDRGSPADVDPPVRRPRRPAALLVIERHRPGDELTADGSVPSR
jgi:hypothetical protein